MSLRQIRSESLIRDYLSKFLSIFIICTTVLPSVIIAADPTVAQIEENQTIQNGESHSFPISLQTGQFVRINVQQQGVDLVVTLLNPDGQVIATSDSPNDDDGTEIISAIATVSGEHKLVIRSLDPKSSGKFTFTVEDLRTAKESDRKYIAAEVAFMEATKINDGTSEKGQQAIA